MKKFLSLLLGISFIPAGFAQIAGVPKVINPMAALCKPALLPLLKKMNMAMNEQHVSYKVAIKLPVLIYQLRWDRTNNKWGDTIEKYIIAWNTNGQPAEIADYHYNSGSHLYSVTHYSNFVKTRKYDVALDYIGASYFYENLYDKLIVENNLQFNFIADRVMTDTFYGGGYWHNRLDSFSFDNQEQFKGYTMYSWMSNIWSKTFKYDYIYDSLGNFRGHHRYVWNKNAWLDATLQLNNFTYNSNGNITSVTLPGYRKEVYTLNADGSINAVNEFTWNASAANWKSLYDVQNVTWYVFKPTTRSTTEDLPYGSPFTVGGGRFLSYSRTDQYKMIQTFNADSSISKIEYQNISSNNTPVNQQCTKFTHYPGGDFKTDITYLWSGTKWVMLSESSNNHFDNNYDTDGDITESTWWSTKSGDTIQPVNLFKTIYQYNKPARIDPERPSDLISIKSFPNPASDLLNVSINNKTTKAENLKIVINNESGNLCFSQTLIADPGLTTTTTLKIDALSAGMYFISVSDGCNILYRQGLVRP